jgi:hypothetical protein
MCLGDRCHAQHHVLHLGLEARGERMALAGNPLAFLGLLRAPFADAFCLLVCVCVCARVCVYTHVHVHRVHAHVLDIHVFIHLYAYVYVHIGICVVYGHVMYMCKHMHQGMYKMHMRRCI